jgi:predicted dinucleotide-binding enzyme
MNIGIIGGGMIGGTLGRLWHRAGHTVRWGTRHPETLAKRVGDLGARAAAGTPLEAARFGDVILLAIPLAGVPEVGRALEPDVSGKIILDACNPYPGRDGRAADEALFHAGGSSAWVSSFLPEARVVKAFNTVYFKTLEEQSHQGDDRVGIPIAGDDASALLIVSECVRQAGFSPVIVGGLAQGKRFEPGAAVYNTGMRAVALASALGVSSPSPFDGRWVSPTREPLTNPDGSVVYAVRDFTMSGPVWSVRFTVHPDMTSDARLFTVEIGGGFRVGAASNRVPGALDAEFDRRFVRMTPHAAPFVGILESACPAHAWKLDAACDVSATGCLTIESADAVPVEYDLLKREGGTLFFGERPIAGNLGSPARRPTRLTNAPVLRR